MKFEVNNRWSGKVQFTAEIVCDPAASVPLKLGLAIKWAVANGADLRSADLQSADLRSADLQSADLRSANLRSADLQSADLRSVRTNDQTIIPPIAILPEGDIIGWKKLSGGAIAKILVPIKAKRVNSTGRKCRAEYVKVLEIKNQRGRKVKQGIGAHDNSTVYRVGRITKPDQFDPDWRVECTHGIHFFITRAEAESY